jgi:hypothetical protein
MKRGPKPGKGKFEEKPTPIRLSKKIKPSLITYCNMQRISLSHLIRKILEKEFGIKDEKQN